jgi:hypothetical protein
MWLLYELEIERKFSIEYRNVFLKFYENEPDKITHPAQYIHLGLKTDAKIVLIISIRKNEMFNPLINMAHDYKHKHGRCK